jgi:hypothetical protein
MHCNKGVTVSNLEYVKFVLSESAKNLAQATGIYAVALIAYWGLVA